MSSIVPNKMLMWFVVWHDITGEIIIDVITISVRNWCACDFVRTEFLRLK